MPKSHNRLKISTSVYLGPEQHQLLVEFTKKTGIPNSEIIRVSLEKTLRLMNQAYNPMTAFSQIRSEVDALPPLPMVKETVK